MITRYGSTRITGRPGAHLRAGLFALSALTAALGATACARATPAGSTAVAAPASGGTIMLRAEALALTRARIARGDPAMIAAAERLRRDADKALTAPLVAVTDKRSQMPPSGNGHDYYSLSPYWWPDPAKADGLPYIRRDGETNPESKRDLDQPRVAEMGRNSHTLAIAWQLTRDERYARRAGDQLRRWFLDTATAMTPHLRFAQLVRGNPNERGSGIIDTRWFIEAVDAAELLRASPGWSAADHAALQRWMGAYLKWLRESPNGRTEVRARNNHGSWFAAQTGALAMFTGDTALVRQIALDAQARIGSQIRPDGSQPIELERTRSMHYSNFNNEALSRVAELGRRVGVDLWSYQAPEGGSLRRAIDHVAMYLPDPAKWPGRQIDAIDVAETLAVLRRAEMAWATPAYEPGIARVDAARTRADRSLLLYPVP